MVQGWFDATTVYTIAVAVEQIVGAQIVVVDRWIGNRLHWIEWLVPIVENHPIHPDRLAMMQEAYYY